MYVYKVAKQLNIFWFDMEGGGRVAERQCSGYGYGMGLFSSSSFMHTHTFLAKSDTVLLYSHSFSHTHTLAHIRITQQQQPY